VEGRQVGDGQCFALWQDYAVNVCGAPASISSTMNTSHPYYAIGVFDGYDVNGAAAYFQKLPATAAAQPGDVAFWSWGSPIAPSSHVAVVLADLVAALDLDSQNSPTPVTRHQVLPKLGLAGYFRPLAGGNGVTVATAADVATPAGNIVTAGQQALDAAGRLSAVLSDPAFWRRAGIMALGIILVLIVSVNIIAPSVLPSPMKVKP